MRYRLSLIVVGCLFLTNYVNAGEGVGFYTKDNPGQITTLKDIGLRLPDPLGEVDFYGSNRTRLYIWDYFKGVTDNDYAHAANRLRLGLKWNQEWFNLHSAFQYTEIQNLPSGTSPGAGTGSLYRANGDGTNDPHGTYLKYLHLDIKDIFDIGITGSVGRFNYANAGSYQTENKKIQWVKSKRISQRVIGGFGWSEFERSFDGVKINRDGGSYHLNFTYFNPTQGGFEERAGRSIDAIDVYSTELTLKEDVWLSDVELQFFHYYYDDSRLIQTGIARRDNTGRFIVTNSQSDIKMDFFGGHLVGALDVGVGELDYMVWGGYQTGDWFELDHEAYTFAAEIGLQFKDLPWKPWIRGGYNIGSGDEDAADSDHGTFFQMLPTARLYSWSILYNMMNNEDTFVMLIMKPFENVTVRSDVHWVSLHESADRWYLGAGPVSLNTAGGYAGRTSSGGNDLGTLVDIGFWWKVAPDITVSGYYGHFFGEEVVENFFATDEDTDFAYMDVTFNF